MSVCAEEQCDGVIHAKGLCFTHYARDRSRDRIEQHRRVTDPEFAKPISPEEQAAALRVKSFDWFVGLFEGEGSIVRHGASRGVRIAIRMTDEDVVKKAQSIAGCGYVRGPFDQGPRRKPIWVWEVTAREDCIDLMMEMYHSLGARRRRQVDIAAAWMTQPDQRLRPIRHGTQAGYQRCRHTDDGPCEPCLAAERERSRDYYRRKKAGDTGPVGKPRRAAA